MNILLLLSFLVNSSFYNLQFNDIGGVNHSMSEFQNKKLLLVNIASSSSRAGQLAGLQQLYQQHGDSLVIIAFPSNSFGNESLSNAQIKTFCENNYGVNFIIAEKQAVAGTSVQPVYNWLTTITQNGMLGEPVHSDFQKYLINKEGQLVGVFSNTVDPMSDQIVNAITEN